MLFGITFPPIQPYILSDPPTPTPNVPQNYSYWSHWPGNLNNINGAANAATYDINNILAQSQHTISPDAILCG